MFVMLACVTFVINCFAVDIDGLLVLVVEFYFL